MKKFKLVSSLGIMACSIALLVGSATNAGATPEKNMLSCSMCHTSSVIGKPGMPKLPFGDFDAPKSPQSTANTLTSLRVKETQAPKLDGKVDTIWNSAKSINVNTYLLKGKDKPSVTLKSIYTDKKVYFLATWKDSTKDVNKNEWTYDGTKWAKTINATTGKANDEDRLSIQWDNGTKGFDRVGCAATCHVNPTDATKMKKIANAGEKADLWHWKATRTSALDFADDTNVTEKGRAADEGVSLEFTNSVTVNGVAQPKFMFKAFNEAKNILGVPVLFASNAVLLDPTATFKAGDKIPGYVMKDVNLDATNLAGPTLSKADIKTYANWENGTWTLEIVRDLNTTRTDDVAFDIKNTKPTAFGVAVHNNGSDEEHGVGTGPQFLAFGPSYVEVNKALVQTNTLKVYTKAATNSKVLITLKKGQKVDIVKSSGKWLTVKTSKGNGYILRTSTNVKITK
jgi:hypothetical protein